MNIKLKIKMKIMLKGKIQQFLRKLFLLIKLMVPMKLYHLIMINKFWDKKENWIFLNSFFDSYEFSFKFCLTYYFFFTINKFNNHCSSSSNSTVTTSIFFDHGLYL